MSAFPSVIYAIRAIFNGQTSHISIELPLKRILYLVFDNTIWSRGRQLLREIYITNASRFSSSRRKMKQIPS